MKLTQEQFNELTSQIIKHGGAPDCMYFPKHEAVVYVAEKKRLDKNTARLFSKKLFNQMSRKKPKGRRGC